MTRLLETSPTSLLLVDFSNGHSCVIQLCLVCFAACAYCERSCSLDNAFALLTQQVIIIKIPLRLCLSVWLHVFG